MPSQEFLHIFMNNLENINDKNILGQVIKKYLICKQRYFRNYLFIKPFSMKPKVLQAC